MVPVKCVDEDEADARMADAARDAEEDGEKEDDVEEGEDEEEVEGRTTAEVVLGDEMMGAKGAEVRPWRAPSSDVVAAEPAKYGDASFAHK